MNVFLTGSAEMRDAIMRSSQVWERLEGFGIGRADVVGQLEFWKEDPINPGDVIMGPIIYKYAAIADLAVYVKQDAPRGVWREGRDRACDLFVEGLYRVRSRALVIADSVGPEERLVMTRHDHLRQIYVEKGLMNPTEQIVDGNVDRSMVEGKHLLGICPPNISHWGKSFTEVEMPMPVSVLKAHEYNVPLDVVTFGASLS